MNTALFFKDFKENIKQKKTLIFSVFSDGFLFPETVPKNTCYSRVHGMIHFMISEEIMSSKPICTSGVMSLKRTSPPSWETIRLTASS